MASQGPRRELRLVTRVGLLIGGASAIAVAVAAMLWNSFGPGPLDVFISGLTRATGVSLAVGYWMALGVMLVAAFALGRRPGFGTVLAPLIIGPVVQLALVVLGTLEAPASVAVRAVVHLLAIGLAGVGAGALVVSGLGAGTGELLATAASDRSGRPEPQVRLLFEAVWLIVGVALGGSFGIGTLLVAVLIGPSVAVGHRLVCIVVDSPRERLRTAWATDGSHPELVPTR